MSAGSDVRESPFDDRLLALLRAADDAASVAHDFIYERQGVTKQEASDAIWCIHNALRPLFEDDPEPATPAAEFVSGRWLCPECGRGYGKHAKGCVLA